jgi:hypothetical protein
MYIWKNGAITDSMAITNDLKISFMTNSSYPTDYVAYYPFSGNSNDMSGRGHNPTITNATLIADRFGQSNSAYNFNGTNNYISIPHSSDFNYSGSDTIAFSYWINVNGTVNNGAVICKANPGGVSNYCTPHGPDSTFLFLINHYGNANGTNSVKILPNQWHHIYISCAQKVCSIFVDGVYNTSKTFTVTPSTNSAPLYLGDDTDGNHEYFKGGIDDIRVYRRVLSEVEIQSLYHEGGWIGN